MTERARQSSDPLPFVQVDRAVKPKAALLAGALGVTQQHALGSLVEFWELCGDPRELEAVLDKTPAGEEPSLVLGEAEIAARFRLASGHELPPALLARLGLLEPVGTALYRVRGMSRFFAPVARRRQAKAAAAAGGKASAKARKEVNGTAQPRSGARSEVAQATPEAPPKRPRSDARSDSEARPEATPEAPPNTEYRVQSTDLLSVPLERAPDEPGERRLPIIDEQHAPTVRRLMEEFAQATGASYGFRPRDARHVAELLALGSPDEVVARWRVALRHQGFPTVRTTAALVQHWNHFPVPAAVRDLPRTPAEKLWHEELDRWREAGGSYIASQAEKLKVVALEDGMPVIETDAYTRDWLLDVASKIFTQPVRFVVFGEPESPNPQVVAR